MAKVTKKELSKGIRLSTQHVYDPLTDIAAEIVAGAISGSQMQEPNAPWTLHFHLPFVDSAFIEGQKDALESVYATLQTDLPEHFNWFVPFVLPPLQENFSATNDNPSILTPYPILDEISFSFDQRAEAMAISDQYYGLTAGNAWVETDSIHPGDDAMLIDLASRYDVYFSIHEKNQTFYMDDIAGEDAALDPTNEAYRASTEIFNAKFAAIDLALGKKTRFNPYVYSEIGATLHPYRTYLIGVAVDDLFDADNPTKRLAMPSINITIKGHMGLVTRDTGAAKPNSPTRHDGVPPYTPEVTITEPTAGDLITADDTDDGVSTSMSVIDQAIGKTKLRGGYGKYGDFPAEGVALKNDMAYEVIAVPMFSNQFQGQIHTTNVKYQPYWQGGLSMLADRRIVRLPYHFSVHHVVGCLNYQNMRGVTSVNTPQNDELYHTIGVGAGTGLHGDKLSYSQIAYKRFLIDNTDGSDHLASLIDRISDPTLTIAGLQYWDLMSIPLVTNSSTSDGTGYTTQNHPFWTGPTITEGRQNTTATRNPIGSIAGTQAVSSVDSADQFIEVRWTIHPETDLNLDSLTGVRTIISGYGGNFVLLIGKKTLV